MAKVAHRDQPHRHNSRRLGSDCRAIVLPQIAILIYPASKIGPATVNHQMSLSMAPI
ncbi:MAG: hypothetical protein JWM69_63, partial [Candidatus Binatus sp.]|nr:hypothetical protein [Candidatus Binatus sp.]